MSGYRGGFGGGNMQQIMKQAQKMREQMEKAQEALEEAEFTGSASGGLVKVTVNGNKNVLGVHIEPSAVDPDDVELLEDLIMAALGDAYAQAQAFYDETMGPFNVGGMM